MTKSTNIEREPVIVTADDEPMTPAPATLGPTIDPSETGMTAIRQIDPDALIIYGVKGPKQLAGSTISAVLMNGEIVMLHQFASGKFVAFRKAAL